MLHLNAEQNLIPLKTDEVIDFLTWLPTDFSAFKNIHAKNAIWFLKTGYMLLPMTSQWRFDKQQFILFINYH